VQLCMPLSSKFFLESIGEKKCKNWPIFSKDMEKVQYKGRSISSRTVLLSKHKVTAKNQNYYKVVLPLLYITYHGLIL